VATIVTHRGTMGQCDNCGILMLLKLSLYK